MSLEGLQQELEECKDDEVSYLMTVFLEIWLYDCVLDVAHIFVMHSCIWIMSCILYFVLMYLWGLRAYDMYVL